jgi:hypothetical protein
MPDHLPDYREMCAPFLGILRLYGGPEHAAYMNDMYLPLADYFRHEYPRLATYHQWKVDLDHFAGPSWEEHVRSASRHYVDQGLLADLQRDRDLVPDQRLDPSQHDAVTLTPEGRERIDRWLAQTGHLVFSQRFYEEPKLRAVLKQSLDHLQRHQHRIRHRL